MTTDGQGMANSRGPNRLDRRKARTRAALVAAAQRLLAEQGRADVSIQEITEAADVGFGSFYNHFTSKDELFDAAVALSLEEHGALLDSVVGDLKDPAEVFSASVRLTGRLQRTHPQMARILVRTGMPYLTSESGLAPQAMRTCRPPPTTDGWTSTTRTPPWPWPVAPCSEYCTSWRPAPTSMPSASPISWPPAYCACSAWRAPKHRRSPRGPCPPCPRPDLGVRAGRL